VQQIRALGSFALTGDPVAGLEKIDAAFESGQTQRLALDAPLPVYVLYWTAIANGDGTVDFRPDVYGRDQELLAALAGRHLLGRVTMNYDTECRKA
jgi:murein L,D-transpeptidase YcbB/YkuD